MSIFIFLWHRFGFNECFYEQIYFQHNVTQKGIYTLLQDQDNAGAVDLAEESVPVPVNTQVIVT